MPRYESPELSFDVPRHWEDRTIVAFAAPKQEGQPLVANLVATRDKLREGETLRGYADRQLSKMSSKLKEMSVLEQYEHSVDGWPAIDVRFDASGTAGALRQRMLLVAVQRTVHCFTATSPRTDVSQNEPLFERMLSSVKFAAEAPPDAALLGASTGAT